jgi:UDP-glucose-4-epimerase GalE
VARVLVTGGAGYIGSHTVRALLEAGHAVVVLDDLSAGHVEALPSDLPFVRAGIQDVAGVAQTIARHDIDTVVHFAAWLDVGESVRKPLQYYRNNVAGTLALLDAAVERGIQRFVFSSTAAVYGETSEMPIAETHDTRPVNAYGETKLTIERALAHVERAHGLRWIALRYFNASGAHPDGTLGEDHDPEIHLIPRALHATTDGPPLQVFGDDYPTPDGTCLRDFIHVCDLADAHVAAIGALAAGGPSSVYNVATGQPHSVMEVVTAVERVTGRPVRWQHAPRRPGDPAVLYASSARLERELGWKPRYPSLDTIVRHAWQWHQGHPKGYRDSTA